MAIILPDGRELRGAQTASELRLEDYFPLARKLAYRWQGTFGSFDDAFSVACQGLVDARDAWEPDRGPFGTVAVLYISARIRDAAHRLQTANAVAPQDRVLRKSITRPGQGYTIVSENQIGPDGSEFSLIDKLADESPDPEAALMAADERAYDRHRLDAALATLPTRDRAIIDARHREGATLEMVSQQHGISRERVRQLEERALRRLREALALPPPPRPKPQPRRLLAPRPAPAAAPARPRRPHARPRPVAWSRDASWRWVAVRWGY